MVHQKLKKYSSAWEILRTSDHIGIFFSVIIGFIAIFAGCIIVYMTIDVNSYEILPIALFCFIFGSYCFYQGFIAIKKIADEIETKGLQRVYEDQKEQELQTEKAKQINKIRALYRAGKISFIEYDTATAKIQGRNSLIESLGVEAALAASHKVDTDRAVEKLAKTNERAIILGSAIGHGIGGLGGGIAGGLSAAAQGNAEMKQMLSEQAQADTAYREALRHSAQARISHTSVQSRANANIQTNHNISSNIYRDLQKISDLHNKGVLNDAEYEKWKNDLLAEM